MVVAGADREGTGIAGYGPHSLWSMAVVGLIKAPSGILRVGTFDVMIGSCRMVVLFRVGTLDVAGCS